MTVHSQIKKDKIIQQREKESCPNNKSASTRVKAILPGGDGDGDGGNVPHRACTTRDQILPVRLKSIEEQEEIKKYEKELRSERERERERKSAESKHYDIYLRHVMYSLL